MFCLQPQSQILYHLTQIATAATTKPIAFCTKTKKQSDQRVTGHVRNEAGDTNIPLVINDAQLLLQHLDKQNLETTNCVKNNEVQTILDQLSLRVTKRGSGNRNKWNVSLSQFIENRHSLLCAPITEPIMAPTIRFLVKQQHKRCTLYIKHPFIGHTQTRHFKVQRTAVAEHENSLSSWYKKFIDRWFSYNKSSKVAAIHLKDATIDEQTIFWKGFKAGESQQKSPRWSPIFIVIGTIVAVFAISQYIRPFESIGFGNKTEYRAEIVDVTFDDCKGVSEAKNELKEIVSYLKNPEKYIAIGGKLPKGILLIGPPGTGKTLLARAVAGEAGVPFFYASGSEFDDLFVGQGARRIRSLFNAAKEQGTAVIFIDELDSVGRKRTTTFLQPYANQTINQLLTEMDGFIRHEGIIVIGATNRHDVLDNALLRPGRFDVEVSVQKPSYTGRKEIFEHYLAKVTHRDIDSDVIARKTPGFTGADIESMVNQAALRAASCNSDYVTMEHLEYALDKQILGVGQHLDNDDERATTVAYHEAGHALVAYYTKSAYPIHKVTIKSSTGSLGHTSYLPKKDEHLISKAQLKANIDVCLGGRIAEELTFGSDGVTTGADSDFEKANTLAENMVKRHGMSEKFGFRVAGDKKTALSPTATELIDNEIKQLLIDSSDRVRTLLKTHAKELKSVAEALLQYETLTGDEIRELVGDPKLSGGPSKLSSTEKSSLPESGKRITPLVQSAKNIL